MAGRTKRYVAGRTIGDRLTVIPVAGYTGHPGIMVTRVVAVSRMSVIDGRPALRRMTHIAFLYRLEMARGHADRGRAVVT